MNTEVKNYHIGVGEQYLAQRVDNPDLTIPVRVVKFDKEVVLRGEGLGDVIVDLEKFLLEGVSTRGRLRFIPTNDVAPIQSELTTYN